MWNTAASYAPVQLKSLKEVKREVIANVEKGANLMTDEWPGYRGVDKHVKRHSVDHSAGEYVRRYYARVTVSRACGRY